MTCLMPNNLLQPYTGTMVYAVHTKKSGCCCSHTNRVRVKMNDMEGVLREQTIHAWRSLDNLAPQEAHVSSRITRKYPTHFGVPLGSVPGWWDERK
eukprot:1160262-Pelagomonas_calceolata.AAC.9